MNTGTEEELSSKQQQSLSGDGKEGEGLDCLSVSKSSATTNADDDEVWR